MAKPIGDTPELTEEETIRFLTKMIEGPTEEQKELSRKIKAQRIVLF